MFFDIPKPPTVPGSHLFFYILGGVVFLLACIAVWDILQKKQTLRHNFPVVAWIRPLAVSVSQRRPWAFRSARSTKERPFRKLSFT